MNKTIKKICAFLLFSSLAMGLVACSGGDNTKKEAPASTEAKTEAKKEEKKEEKSEAKSEEKKDEKTEAKKDDDKKAEAKTRAGKMTTEFDLSKQEAGKVVKLWVPIPKDDDYQKIENLNVEFDKAHAKSETNEDEFGNKILYIEWDKEATDRKATVSFDAKRTEILRPELVEKDEAIPEDIKQYLEPNSMVPVDGKVKEIADKITEGKKTVLEKERAIYDWIIANMERDDSVIGCGQGDVLELFQTPKGKCTDIHSVFVGLSRAAGIPARETFGIRMSKDPQAEVTKAQHCWAEFYLPGTGWVAVDPGDVLKAVLTNGWAKDAPETKELQEYLWGNIEPVRVGLSMGRDLKLVPEISGEALNNFGYPYAEVDGVALDFYQPDQFSYKYTFEEAK